MDADDDTLTAAGDLPAEVGDEVAHYRIVALLARGGMGVVYRARDEKLRRDVALKSPWPHLAEDPTIRERFVLEARSTAVLSHPNIVAVHEILEWRGFPWVAMDLVDGPSLGQLLRERRPLPLPVTLRIAEGIAAALVAAHGKRILHRDLKPSNILIRPDGWPMLTDFGLAHVLSRSGLVSGGTTLAEPLTSPGQILGTPSYMSPEQVLGKRLDARSDLFSLGAVLFELCSGRRAFAAEGGGNELDAILNREPPALRLIASEVPEVLERIVAKALAKDPDRRYQSAAEMHDEITALRLRLRSAGDLTPASTAEKEAASRPTSSRMSAPIGWAALALLLLAGGWLLFRGRAGEKVDRGVLAGTPRQITSDPGWESEPALAPDGSLIAYSSNVTGNAEIWIVDARGGGRLRLTDDPAEDRAPAWLPDGSGVLFVSERSGEPSIWSVPKLGGPAALVVPNAVDPAVSPDGRRVAFARVDASGNARIAAAPLADTGSFVWLTDDTGGLWDHQQPAWSPDGTSLVYADARALWIVPAAGGRARPLTQVETRDADPAWSSDGEHVLFSSYREGTLALWRVAAAGGAAERLTVGSGPESQASVSRDGARLVYSTNVHDFDLALVDLATGTRQVLPGLLDESDPTLAPDGSALVYATLGRGARNSLWLQPLSPAGPVETPRQLFTLGGGATTPAYSPDGRWIAFKREAEGRREIWIVSAEGGPPARVSDGSGQDIQPAWSADSGSILFASERDGGSKIWSVPVAGGRSSGKATLLTTGEGIDLVPAASPDGEWLAFARLRSDGEELWLQPLREPGAARRLVGAAEIGRVRWEGSSARILFAGRFGGGPLALWSIAPEGGELLRLPHDPLLGAAPPGSFDVASDGRRFAYSRVEIRGDIWMLDADAGAF